MATLELILLLLATVLISSVVDQLLPKISTPLVQILMGMVIALIAEDRITITLNADVFLVVFIAPLLFYEATEADKTSLWKNKGTLVSYAVGLVVVITLSVGFAVHALIPSISLATAFALGAALGPTDAVAVASVSKEAAIPPRRSSILQGESLLNDASGIVSFRFALAAAVTGSFSMLAAVGDFAVEFFGGILLGLVCGFAINWTIRRLRAMGLENITFHVSFEVFTPFIVYLLGNMLHVSGVLCVVVCGIVMSLTRQSLGPSVSRLNIVSSSVWKVLSFALNGVVFVLLGTQLPNAIGNTWLQSGIGWGELTLYIFVITGIMHGTRFIWSFFTDLVSDRKSEAKIPLKERVRSALIMTLSGAKGTITLAIMFTIPVWVNGDTSLVAFPNRNLLIFLASGVIVLSLLLATYVVPLLAPRKDEPEQAREEDVETQVEIMRAVIENLTAQITPQNRLVISEVIGQYNGRIERIKNNNSLDDESDTDLRISMLQKEQEYILDRIDEGTVPAMEGYEVLSNLAHGEAMLQDDRLRAASVRRNIHRWWGWVRTTIRRLISNMPGPDPSNGPQIKREIQIDALKYAIDVMQKSMSESDIATESFSRLILEYQRSIRALRAKSPSITAITKRENATESIIRPALQMELEQIQSAYDEGRLSRPAAQAMRRNVHLMQLDLEGHV